METRVTEYIRLFKKARADRPKLVDGIARAPVNEDEEQEWRLRGFLFTVDQQTAWVPEADTTALMRIGRWIAGYEVLGIGAYTTMRNQGFAICFSREADAKGFEFQCLENEYVFTSKSDAHMLQSDPSARRNPRTQLPSRACRSLSKPFSDLLMNSLHYEVKPSQLENLRGVRSTDCWRGYEAYRRAKKG